MTEPLSRAQVEDIWKGLDKTLEFHAWCAVKNMVGTDASLRAHQDKLTQRLEGRGEEIEALKQQLAAAQNELCTAKDQIPPDMEGDSLSVALIKLKDIRREARARIKELEARP